eukprot:4754377-Pyramimonas_sp.AAC.1
MMRATQRRQGMSAALDAPVDRDDAAAVGGVDSCLGDVQARRAAQGSRLRGRGRRRCNRIAGVGAPPSE